MKKKLIAVVVTAFVVAVFSLSASATIPDATTTSGKLDFSSMVVPIKSDRLKQEDIINIDQYSKLLDEKRNPNWGWATYLGRFKGQPVRLIWNQRTQIPTIFLGLEPKVTLASLEVEDVDSLRNRATLRRGAKAITVNFNNAGAFDGLERRLSRLPPGWKEEGYTYSFDRRYSGSNSTLPTSTQVIIALPDNAALRKEFIKAILSLGIHRSEVYGNVYDSGRQVNSVKDYATRMAESCYLSSVKDEKLRYTPGKPHRIATEPYTSIIDTYEFFPERITDRYLTMNVFHASRYPFGGGGFDQLVSYTFDRKTGKQLKYDDIFTAGSRAKINDIYFNAIADQLNKKAKRLDLEQNNTAKTVFDAFMDGKLPEDKIKQSEYKITTPVALGDDGVIFSYDSSLIYGCGEDPIETVVVPYSRLSGLMKIKP